VKEENMYHWIEALLRDLESQATRRDTTTTQEVNRVIKIIKDTGIHHFRTDELSQIADDIAESTDLTELAELLWKAATSCGFEHFALFVTCQGDKGAFRTRVSTSFNEEWIARYEEMNYASVDPVLSAAALYEAPFSFSDLPNTSPCAQAFWKDAYAHRIGGNGICFPKQRADGSKLGVSFLTRKNADKAKQCIDRSGFDLEFISELAVECFCFLSQGQHHHAGHLSMEELRFLHALSTDGDPTRALSMTSSFGSNKSLQSSIRQKLGVDTVFQAISIASRNHWFDSLPYEPKEVVVSHPKLLGLESFSLAGRAMIEKDIA
jgi:hypothetical protein